ncbi:hypothetical protein PR002_g5694 [Phytophthora rubi]|uniref:Uncharacterized protein n=1 Tax=Phytophthora rubi TaxID=129364 RepID=A0A6A3N6L6_9STRA|nr:hypothetical protein PR002_g5694 [Phytophthora rubi]
MSLFSSSHLPSSVFAKKSFSSAASPLILPGFFFWIAALNVETFSASSTFTLNVSPALPTSYFLETGDYGMRNENARSY